MGSTMNEQDFAVVKTLCAVAWADGEFADREREMLEGLLEAYNASPDDRAAIFAYASEKRSLEDIPLQDLSAQDRRVALNHAVLLSFVDGEQAEGELAFLQAMAAHLRIPAREAEQIIASGAERAKRFVPMLHGS